MKLLDDLKTLLENPFFDTLANFIKKFKSSKSFYSIFYFLALFTTQQAIAWKYGTVIAKWFESLGEEWYYQLGSFIFEYGSIELVILGIVMMVLLAFVEIFKGNENSHQREEITIQNDNNGVANSGDNNIINQTINNYSYSRTKRHNIWLEIKELLSFILFIGFILLIQQTYAWYMQRDSYFINNIDLSNLLIAIPLSLLEISAWIIIFFLPITLFHFLKMTIHYLKPSFFSLFIAISTMFMVGTLGVILSVSFIFLFINPNFINLSHSLINLSSKERQWLYDIDETKVKINIAGKSCEVFEVLNAELDIKNDNFNRDFKYKNFESNKYYVTNIKEDYQKLDGLEKALQSAIKRNKKKVDSIWIFLRGYADTSKSKDKLYPMLNGYKYKKVKYYNYNKDTKLYLINPYLFKIRTFQNNQFNNKDLPYLRSQFVYKEYFEKFNKTLDTSLKIHLAILENEPTNIVNQKYRKVETYISFCQNITSGGGCSRLKETSLK